MGIAATCRLRFRSTCHRSCACCIASQIRGPLPHSFPTRTAISGVIAARSDRIRWSIWLAPGTAVVPKSMAQICQRTLPGPLATVTQKEPCNTLSPAAKLRLEISMAGSSVGIHFRINSWTGRNSAAVSLGTVPWVADRRSHDTV